MEPQRQLIIKQGLISGDVEWENPDGLTAIELVGLLEWAKIMITAQLIEEGEENHT